MYIESHVEIREHPKTKRLARLMMTNVREAIGLLHIFWWWVMQYAPNGDLNAYTPADIDDGCDCSNLHKSLMEAGWIDPDNTVHDWFEYGGKLHIKRMADRQRKQESRASSGHPAGVQQTSSGRPKNSGADIQRKSQVEKSRVDQRRREDPPPTPSGGSAAPKKRIPTEYPPEFETLWDAYPRTGNKKETLKLWREWQAGGVPVEEMQRGAEGYAEACKRERTEEQYIKRPETFFGEGEHWRNYLNGKKPVNKWLQLTREEEEAAIERLIR